MGVLSAVEALRTTSEALDPGALRERLVQALHALGHADGVLIYPLAQVGNDVSIDLGRCRFLGLPESGVRQSAAGYKQFVGFSGLLEPGRQGPAERKDFLEYDAIVPRAVASRTRFYQEVMRAARLGDQQRLLVYEGARFAGWLGFFRAPGRRFTREDRRAMRPLVEPAQALVRLSARLDGEAPISEAAELVLSPRGEILHASRTGRQWLELEGLGEALRRQVREFDAGREPATCIYGGAGLRLVRLDGAQGVAYLALLEPARPLIVHPLDQLPPSLSAVARAAARGAADKEIAAELELSLATVRTYMTRAMKRLGVDHRAKLAILAASPPPLG